PNWFTTGFPSYPLDGELWAGRSNFEKLVSIVRKQHPIDSEWRQVKYMVFELPETDTSFSQRLDKLRQRFSNLETPYIHLLSQFRLQNHQALMAKLNEIVEDGGEGLMLHRADAIYHIGRSKDLLKVKTYLDAEATVIAHFPGKGKYKNKLGALLVEMPGGQRFRIGTGFSDPDRESPPPIGSLVTYKYYGKTRKGIPRFASSLKLVKFVQDYWCNLFWRLKRIDFAFSLHYY
ncbi:MAG: DNA ligase, partial [Methylococcaceae bacterium]